MIKIVPFLAGIIMTLTLAACGQSTGDRAVSGAGIGAGVGAVGAAVTGGNAGTGALIGAAVGGIGGAATSQRDIDLGKPVWRQCDRDADGYKRC